MPRGNLREPTETQLLLNLTWRERDRYMELHGYVKGEFPPGWDYTRRAKAYERLEQLKRKARKLGRRENICLCRPPRGHRDCAYCGTGRYNDWWICGRCKEAGIDGKVIPGTWRVTCRIHKREEAQ